MTKSKRQNHIERKQTSGCQGRWVSEIGVGLSMKVQLSGDCLGVWRLVYVDCVVAYMTVSACKNS